MIVVGSDAVQLVVILAGSIKEDSVSMMIGFIEVTMVEQKVIPIS